MTPTDPSTWTAGMVVLHRSGSVATLHRPYADGKGWWIKEGGGISDHAVAGGGWIALTPAHVALLFNLAGAG